MAVSTFEIVALILLGIAVAVALWWYIVAEKYSNYMDSTSYARGANASSTDKTLNLSCGKGKKICVYRATQICTAPNPNNWETSTLEPIAGTNTADAQWGAFDPVTTVDLTGQMGAACNGSSDCQWKKGAPDPYPGGRACLDENGNPGTSQIISTYTCIPEGEECQAYTPFGTTDPVSGQQFPTMPNSPTCPPRTYGDNCQNMMCPGGVYQGNDGSWKYSWSQADNYCKTRYGSGCNSRTGECGAVSCNNSSDCSSLGNNFGCYGGVCRSS